MERLDAALRLIARMRRRPARYLLRRLVAEAHVERGRLSTLLRDRRFGERELLAATDARSVDELWTRLAARPFPAAFDVDAAAVDEFCPGERARITAAGADAVARRVDLLGSGPVLLGAPIDWSRDFKTDRRWPRRYALRMQYNDPELPSDVKVPWELSRLQWLIPAGQAYRLTGDESYARAARDVLDEWIAANPYAYSIVWSVTMEVAIRILGWTWLFHAFSGSHAWSEPAFRLRFLRALHLHGEFTEQYIERSDVNGNHYTADAVGMLCAGLFFGDGVAARRWSARGWLELCDELPRQVFADGVDFEASAAYHRLVGELFLLGARYQRAVGGAIPDGYRERLVAMAQFVAVSARPDGGAPLWGDGDDARALPLGGQRVDDHRYFVGLVATLFRDEALARSFSGPLDEVLWSGGRAACAWLAEQSRRPLQPASRAFTDGGVFVMRSEDDYVFIDCGPVGLQGRGGHGHNDCLSFEASLRGRHLVTDCGSYLYTASYDERNRFRSSRSHNTPCIAGQELNRFAPRDIWILQNDAIPDVRSWQVNAETVRFCGSHRGYERLAPAVRPVRTVVLDRARPRLAVLDQFEAAAGAEFAVEIPLHLAVGVTVVAHAPKQLILDAAGERFRLVFTGAPDWQLALEPARASARYGVAQPIVRLCWRARATALSWLAVAIAPFAEEQAALSRWSESLATAVPSPRPDRSPEPA